MLAEIPIVAQDCKIDWNGGEDHTLPGLVGAGTALLVVSVVGALSFQSWRKNNN